MSEFKGTPGKWESRESFCKKFDQEIINIDSDKGFSSFVTVYSGGLNNEQSRCDAKLIAHAPELLEILKQILKEHEIGIIQGLDSKVVRELIKSATE